MNQPDTIRKNINKFILDYNQHFNSVEKHSAETYFTCCICKYHNYWVSTKTMISHEYIMNRGHYTDSLSLCDDCNRKFLERKDRYSIEQGRREYKKILNDFKKKIGGRRVGI